MFAGVRATADVRRHVGHGHVHVADIVRYSDSASDRVLAGVRALTGVRRHAGRVHVVVIATILHF